MLGVIDRLAAMLVEKADRVPDHPEVFIEGGAEDLANVERPALADEGADWSLGGQECPEARVLFSRDPFPSRAGEGGEARAFQPEVPGLREECLVLGIGAGPAALNVVDAELVQLAGD